MPFVDPDKKREYKKEWNKNYYKKNKKKEIARVAKRKQELRDWLDEYKRGLECETCGETHIACLDFHHRDAKTKDFTVGNIKEFGWGRERVLLEIKKCVVVCANCHRKLHFKAAAMM